MLLELSQNLNEQRIQKKSMGDMEKRSEEIATGLAMILKGDIGPKKGGNFVVVMFRGGFLGWGAKQTEVIEIFSNNTPSRKKASQGEISILFKIKALKDNPMIRDFLENQRKKLREMKLGLAY